MAKPKETVEVPSQTKKPETVTGSGNGTGRLDKMFSSSWTGFKKVLPFVAVFATVLLLMWYYGEIYRPQLTPWGWVLIGIAVFVGIIAPLCSVELGAFKGWLTAALIIGTIAFAVVPIAPSWKGFLSKFKSYEIVEVPAGMGEPSERIYKKDSIVVADVIEGDISYKGESFNSTRIYFIRMKIDAPLYFTSEKGGKVKLKKK
ncbi:MAG: hypothetical protein V1891_05245 [bacterium]